MHVIAVGIFVRDQAQAHAEHAKAVALERECALEGNKGYQRVSDFHCDFVSCARKSRSQRMVPCTSILILVIGMKGPRQA